jgi:hypothetical protein
VNGRHTSVDRYSELLVFTRAVAEGDFSAAARSLSLTPSAVSKLVSRLENRLGVRLFSRSSRRMALTPEGEKFYSAALRAIDAVEEADTAVAPNNLHGDTLRIRSAPTFAASQLAPLILPSASSIHRSASRCICGWRPAILWRAGWMWQSMSAISPTPRWSRVPLREHAGSSARRHAISPCMARHAHLPTWRAMNA